MITC
jgi:hypothetical protein